MEIYDKLQEALELLEEVASSGEYSSSEVLHEVASRLNVEILVVDN